MLDLAKIERGKMELRLSFEDPLLLAGDAADFFRAKAAEKKIKLLFEAAAGPARARLDRELITHALSNFISNALKFTPEGGTVSVRGRHAGEQIPREVADTGPGLARAKRKRSLSVRAGHIGGGARRHRAWSRARESHRAASPR